MSSKISDFFADCTTNPSRALATVQALSSEDLPHYIGYKSPRGMTPLYSAVGAGHRELVQVLIASGSPINFRTPRSGYTPLARASILGYHHIAALLLSKGASCVSDETESTPLRSAASRGNYRVVETLLAAGASAETPDVFGITPLGAAAESGATPIVILLLAVGANPWATSLCEHSTPIDVAKAKGFFDILQLFESLPLPLHVLCKIQIRLSKIRLKFQFPSHSYKELVR